MKNKNYKKFFMCSLFVLNTVGMHSDCEINIGRQILEAVHRSEKFPFIKYDDEFYSNVPSKTFDKKIVNSFIPRILYDKKYFHFFILLRRLDRFNSHVCY